MLTYLYSTYIFLLALILLGPVKHTQDDIDVVAYNTFPTQTKTTFSFGTAFCGVPLFQDLWNSGICRFNIEPSLRSKCTTFHSNSMRLCYSKLPQVDVLVLQHNDNMKAWSHFMSQLSNTLSEVQTILYLCPESVFLLEKGDIFRQTTRKLRHLGYHLITTHLDASKCGSSTGEKYLLTVAQLTTNPTVSSFQIETFYPNLPVRPCSNSIRTWNIPKKSYVKLELDTLLPGPADAPQNLLGYYKGDPVYSITGCLGSSYEHQWIYVPDKGIRRLLREEWMKLRGYEDSDDITVSTSGLVYSLSSHVWSVLGNVLATVSGRDTLKPSSTCDENPTSDPPTPPPEPVQSNWSWEPPRLDKDSSFRREALQRLHVAVQSFPLEQQEALYYEGLTLLDKHSKNFTEAGPLKLVNLWWFWPSDHWIELCYGLSMNFMEAPPPGILPNQEMNDETIRIAVKFMDQLIDLEVFLKCDKNEIHNNFPLFVVPKPKPEQKGEFRCIADGKKGGQNAFCVPDPVQMTSPEHILPRLYRGGYSSILDMSKYFHMFKTREDEQKYMGVVHPGTGDFYKYGRLPMGSRNSPGGSGRFGFAFLRYLIESNDIFGSSSSIDNTFAQTFMPDGKPFDPSLGEGRVYFSEDGSPAVLLWLHVDDLFVHGPTLEKLEKAMTYIVDVALSFGLVIQPAKVELPAHIVQYCGFIYNTTNIPTLEVPSYKLTRASAMVSYLLSGSYHRLARMTLAVVVGNLQSLVPASPSNIGNSYLRSLYNDLHSLDSPLQGQRAYFFTALNLSSESLACLRWWKNALQDGFSRQAYPSDTATIGITWGDGSGSGAGGTRCLFNKASSSSNFISVNGDLQPKLPRMDIWMGVWSCKVHSYSSNWKELRTLEQTLILEKKDGSNRMRNKRLFYFTDNQVTYDICHKSTSSSPELMKLILNIRLLELQLGCHLVVVHVPGVLMITQGTDGYSRGVMPSAFTSHANAHPMYRIFRAPLFSPALLSSVTSILGLSPHITWHCIDCHSPWTLSNLLHQHTFWCISPQLARQAVLQATYAYCESPLDTSHIFVIPRLLLRQFQRLNRYYTVYGPFWNLPVGYHAEVPFVILHFPPFCRETFYYSEKEARRPRLDLPASAPTSRPYWITHQLDTMHGV